MQGAATVLHHPLHPMLTVFPIAFFISSLAADAAYLAFRRAFWQKCALALIGFGILGGLAAVMTGLVEYWTAPMTADAFEKATDHLIANLVVVGLFTANFVLRWRRPGIWPAYALSLIGFLALIYSGWLGGELVFRHGVGVLAAGSALPAR